ncbi:MAG: hypothetical protein LC745_08960 [Planctomycetia bacterium]|nr:hypothetical protein [Planctomycetia bacterium]
MKFRSVLALFLAVLGVSGCGGNPNEKGFETVGVTPADAPKSAEEYESGNKAGKGP